MSLITRMLRQVAVYWPPTHPDDQGEPISGEPIEIRCRWEDAAKAYLDKNGVETTSNSIVYVDRDLEIGGILWQGKLADIDPDTTHPYKNKGAAEIKQFGKLPNLRATEHLRTAWL